VRRTRTAFVVAVALLPALALTACGARQKAAALASATVGISAGTPASSLRLGYFANITHAPAILAVADGDLAKQLGSTTLKTQVFNAGPAEVTALLGGSIDAAFVGPSPAINAFVQSKGDFVIVAGAMSGGAELVVKPSITTIAELKGAKIATPQLGNTQDVAARAFMASHGFTTNTTGGGTVHLLPASSNAAILTSYKSGAIDGAWVPEPYASRLVDEDGAHVLVDEKTLWPQGMFTTTVLVVNKAYLTAHGATIKALIQSELDAISQLQTDPSGSEATINGALKSLGGSTLKPDVLTRAFSEITPTVDPIASSLAIEQSHAVAAGLLKPSSLNGIFQLAQLNALLSADGKPAVSDAGY
jgi:NitT/TauT family transport system substrate-binding protein